MSDDYENTIEQALFGLVSAGLSGATVGRRRGQKTAYPFVSYSKSDDEHEFDLAGPAGVSVAVFEFEIASPNYVDLGRIGRALFVLLCNTTGEVGDREVMEIQSQGESDDVEQPGDGGQNVIYVRTQRYQVLYVE